MTTNETIKKLGPILATIRERFPEFIASPSIEFTYDKEYPVSIHIKMERDCPVFREEMNDFSRKASEEREKIEKERQKQRVE